MSRARQQHPAAAQVAALGERAHHRFRAVLRRRQVHLQAVSRQPLGGGRPHHAEPHPLERAQILGPASSRSMNASTALRAREDDPVELRHPRARVVERAIVVGRHDADHRRFDGVGAHRLERVDELARLFARPRHENAFAEQRTRVEPAQMLAQRRHAPDDQNRRPPIAPIAWRAASSLLDRAGDRFLRRQRAVVDDRRRVVRPAGRARGARQHVRATAAARRSRRWCRPGARGSPNRSTPAPCRRPRGRARR